MKSFLILFALLAVNCNCVKISDYNFMTRYLPGLTEHELTDIERMSTECKAEYPVNTKLILDTEKGIYSEDRNLKCYYMCVFKKYGVMDSNGIFKLTKVKGKISDANMKLSELCTQSSTEDHCDKAYAGHKCFLQKYLNLKS